MTPSKTEGAGKTGCALHPRSRVQNCAKKRTRAYRYSRSIPASLRNGFTAYAVLSPATNSSCHRHRRSHRRHRPSRRLQFSMGLVVGSRGGQICLGPTAPHPDSAHFSDSRPRLSRYETPWRLANFLIFRNSSCHPVDSRNIYLPVPPHRGAYPDRQRRGAGCGEIGRAHV